MAARTVAVSSKELDKAVEVLSSASDTLQLTRFESLSYRALMVCADVATASFFGCLLSLVIAGFLGAFERDATESIAFISYLAFFVVFVVAILVGIVSLVLNIPLLLRTFRERARLKQLGLSSLSHSLLKESRRGRWTSWVRRVAFIGTVILWLSVMALFLIGWLALGEQPSRADLPLIISAGLFFGVVPGLLIAAQYLRSQRERIDLTASAEELRKAFQSLLQHPDTGVVSVPADLLERTAKIESAQIAEQRKDAILESTTTRPAGYAVTFARTVAEKRDTLDVADRVELGDLVAQISTGERKLEPQEGTGHGSIKGSRVEIDYEIDHASRTIHVMEVQHLGEVSHASVNGARHA
jgi:hypothetical protein